MMRLTSTTFGDGVYASVWQLCAPSVDISEWPTAHDEWVYKLSEYIDGTTMKEVSEKAEIPISSTVNKKALQIQALFEHLAMTMNKDDQ